MKKSKLTDEQIGFAVIYRWRLRAGMEEQFQTAWAKVTEVIRDERGGLGSRLHRADDGSWVAYAQWPDREAWERSQASGPADTAASAMMAAAVEESLAPVRLEPVADYLAGG